MKIFIFSILFFTSFFANADFVRPPAFCETEFLHHHADAYPKKVNELFERLDQLNKGDSFALLRNERVWLIRRQIRAELGASTAVWDYIYKFDETFSERAAFALSRHGYSTMIRNEIQFDFPEQGIKHMVLHLSAHGMKSMIVADLDLGASKHSRSDLLHYAVSIGMTGLQTPSYNGNISTMDERIMDRFIHDVFALPDSQKIRK